MITQFPEVPEIGIIHAWAIIALHPSMKTYLRGCLRRFQYGQQLFLFLRERLLIDLFIQTMFPSTEGSIRKRQQQCATPSGSPAPFRHNNAPSKDEHIRTPMHYSVLITSEAHVLRPPEQVINHVTIPFVAHGKIYRINLK